MKESEKKKEYQKQICQKKHGVNIGHLTHIEKGTRKPSHKALKNIASSLQVPYQPLFYSYDKELDEKQIEYDYIKHINYNKIPAISKIDDYIDCPIQFANANFAYKCTDDAMSPIIKKNSYAFIEINGLLKHKDIGLFRLNNEFIIRKLMYKKDHFVLKANDKNFKDITISDSDDFQIIGKVYI